MELLLKLYTVASPRASSSSGPMNFLATLSGLVIHIINVKIKISTRFAMPMYLDSNLKDLLLGNFAYNFLTAKSVRGNPTIYLL